ncbi:MAG: murein biosynthesis integral membrane protein MurJ [Candidatus Omnitrophica bacterium]|nr:murein biosynthesis integral membrane protein MurJ [Candidatus Omnitrophota bacterium]
MTTSIRSIGRSTGILALATAVSRVLGFVRDVFIAALFGATAQAQAFVVAFRLPNLLRDLVAEGAVTSAFVPVLSWYRSQEKPEEFWRLNEALLTRLFLLVCVLGAAGALAAPQIVRAIAPGFAEDPDKFALTVLLTRILFPFITLVGLWAYFMGLLNSLHRFAVPALGPAVLNLAMIAACVWWVPKTSPGIVALAVSILIGGLVQLLISLPLAIRLGFRWRWRWHHPGSTEVTRLLGPRLIGASVYQASVLVHTALASMASLAGEGAVAALYYANRLVQLPLALFGTASAQASLPSLASFAAQEDLKSFCETLIPVIRMVGFVILPSSIGLMVLAEPIVVGLFQRGAFDQAASTMTAQVLVWYAVGLMAYSLSKVVTGAFYALRNTWTATRLAIEAMVINVILSIILMIPFKVTGLAMAAAISNSFNSYRLLRALECRLNMPLWACVLGPLTRMSLAALFMGASCSLAWNAALRDLPAWLGLCLAILGGVVTYVFWCWIFRVQELVTLKRWLGRIPFIQLFIGE